MMITMEFLMSPIIALQEYLGGLPFHQMIMIVMVVLTPMQKKMMRITTVLTMITMSVWLAIQVGYQTLGPITIPMAVKILQKILMTITMEFSIRMI